MISNNFPALLAEMNSNQLHLHVPDERGELEEDCEHGKCIDSEGVDKPNSCSRTAYKHYLHNV